jgi:hypothetical protein
MEVRHLNAAVFSANIYSYTSICEALGVDLLSQEGDFQRFLQRFLQVYRSRNPVACCIQEVTRARLSGEGAAVGTHGRGSDNAGGPAPQNRPDAEPRNAGCQPSPTKATTGCSSEEPSMKQSRPTKGLKHCRNESTTSRDGVLAKRGKTQQDEDRHRHDGVSEMPDETLRTSAAMDCPKCGKGNISGRDTCEYCGAELPRTMCKPAEV